MEKPESQAFPPEPLSPSPWAVPVKHRAPIPRGGPGSKQKPEVEAVARWLAQPVTSPSAGSAPGPREIGGLRIKAPKSGGAEAGYLSLDKTRILDILLGI